MTTDLTQRETAVLRAALAWVEALDAKRAADEAFRTFDRDTLEARYKALRTTEHAADLASRDLRSAARETAYQDDGDDRALRLRKENERLRDQVAKLQHAVACACENNHVRNLELDALHYVWCNGGCVSGVHRYCGKPEDITEELVATAERNTARLRSWFRNRQNRIARGT